MSFHELATTAAIGTGQRPFRPDHLPEPLRHLVDPEAEPALQVLDAAAGWEVVRRAELPAGHEPQLFPEAPETRPEPPAGLTALLRRILELADGDQVLAETCSALHAAGLRLPHRLLAPVLERGRKDDALLAAVRPVIGARGEWLIQALPSAARARSVPQARHWDDGIRLRVGWLAHLSRTDPTAAIDLLNRSWREESLENRLEFLGVLAAEPHPAQVDFLEQALLDRSGRVAKAAREALAKLPSSPWRARMLGYAAGLRVEDGGLVFDQAPTGKQATADGATGEDGRSVVTAAVPPAQWPRLLGLPATALLHACQDDPATVLALGRAAAAFRDGELAAAVLPRLEPIAALGSGYPALVWGAERPALASELLEVTDIPTRLMIAERSTSNPMALFALRALPAPWPQQVVDIALTRLDQWRAAKRPQAEAAFKLIEQAVSPWLATAALQRVNPEPRHTNEPPRRVARLITVLTLRAAVFDEIRPYLNQENR